MGDVVYLDLTMFDEGGAPAAAGGADGTGAQTAPAAEGQAEKPVSFKDLLKSNPEYMAEHKREIDAHVMRRMKGHNAQMERLNALEPAVQLMASRLGVDPSDTTGLLKALERDRSMVADKAAALGISEDQYLEMESLKNRNAYLEKAMQNQQQEARVNQIYAGWVQQGEELTQIYPDFDFDAEMENEQFTKMLRAGVDVRHAYEVLHRDEIIGGAMQFAVQKTAQKVTNDIRARGMRPAENGAGNGAGGMTRGLRASDMSREDILRLAAEAKRGKITPLAR